MDSDYVYALLLQEQLSNENAFQSSPKFERSVSSPNKENYHRNNKDVVKQKGSLIDPSWEMIDPTPNIHTLFMQFDKRFFWNKLNAVIVTWSKRMTTCAGVCSYEGRGGACKISLSEPLLKLRPRKDLVETLLHEMIHAYLFVTHNNRDRNGHGPEFHKHMYRINSEAGTKITVYHDFHDEVRLYKTHWWRCNGPCQTRRPYFGMVKRASNRAPGPNDRWWDEHSRTCGGTFIKIREPDSKSKKSGELATRSVPVTDIRNFFEKSPVKGSSPNIHTLKDFNTDRPNKIQNHKKPSVATSSGINSFVKPTKPGTGVLNKGTGTLVVTSKTGKQNVPTEKDENPFRLKTFQPFGGDGHVLKASGTTRKPTDDHEYATVRNVWLNKFQPDHKRPSSEPKPESPKKAKTDALIDLTEDSDDDPRCPLCSKTLTSSEINTHVDSCLENSFNDDFDDLEDAEVVANDKKINCLVCNKLLNESSLNSHLENCMNDVFEDELHPEENSRTPPPQRPQTVQINSIVEKIVGCPCCPKLFPESQINEHLDICLSKDFE